MSETAVGQLRPSARSVAGVVNKVQKGSRLQHRDIGGISMDGVRQKCWVLSDYCVFLSNFAPFSPFSCSFNPTPAPKQWEMKAGGSSFIFVVRGRGSCRDCGRQRGRGCAHQGLTVIPVRNIFKICLKYIVSAQLLFKFYPQKSYIFTPWILQRNLINIRLVNITIVIHLVI